MEHSTYEHSLQENQDIPRNKTSRPSFKCPRCQQPFTKQKCSKKEKFMENSEKNYNNCVICSKNLDI